MECGGPKDGAAKGDKPASFLYRPLFRELVRGALGRRLRGQFFDELGLSESYVDGTSDIVAMPRLPDFWSVMTRLSGDPAIGLRAAMNVDLSQLGVMSRLMAECKDLRTFIEWMCRFMPTVFSHSHCHFRVCGRVASFEFSCVVNRDRQLHDFLMALAYRTAQTIVPGAINDLVTFPHQAAGPTDVELYQQIFQCAVRFQDERVSCEFDAAHLDVPNQAGGRRAWDDMVPWAPDSPSSRTHIRAVEVVYERAVRAGRFGAKEIAEDQGIALRAWRQRLAKVATNHREQLHRARRIVACELLRDRARSLEEISSDLGFTHPSAFGRAFSRWTGATPMAYRRLYRET